MQSSDRRRGIRRRLTRATAASLMVAMLASVAASPAAAQPPPYMQVVQVQSGVTDAGKAWLHLTFSGPFPPPPDTFSWFIQCFLQLLGSGRQFFYLLQMHDGERSEVLSGPQGAGGKVRDVALPDGSLVLIFPFAAEPGDLFFIESGEMLTPDGERMVFQQGTASDPIEISGVVGDPLEMTSSPSPSPSPTTEVPTGSPSESPDEPPDTESPVAQGEEDGAGLNWIVLVLIVIGGLVIVVIVVMIVRRRPEEPVPGHPWMDDAHPGSGSTHGDPPSISRDRPE